MPTLLMQREKGDKAYEEVGPQHPLAVEVYQGNGANPSVVVVPPAYQVLGYTSFTIGATAGTMFGLADSGMLTKPPEGAQSFSGVLETGAVRARGDATAPTTTQGQLVSVGDVVYLSQAEFNRTRFIATGASGVVKGHFYDVPIGL